MKSETNQNVAPSLLAMIIALMYLLPGASSAQVPVDENGVALEGLVADLGADDTLSTEELPLSAWELEDLVDQIALYPDDLLAIVLPASTYPLQIVQAARFLEQFEIDSTLKPDDSWDESVTALLNYPEVIELLNEDIDWTWRLGEAVIAQQEELIAAIESFRDRAYAAGNLKSDERQKVRNDDGVIEITPVNEEIIYVPYYEPEEVVVYQPRPVYYYYPEPYPVYYYPYPVGHRFTSGYFWGVTTAYSIGWNNRYLHVYHPTYWGHPYYGRTYYSNYYHYRRPSINIYNSWYVNNRVRVSRDNHRNGDYWRPRNRSGARPYEQRVRNRHIAPQPDSRSTTYTRANGSRSSAENVVSRNHMQTRSNGRLDLGLRERARTTTNNSAGRYSSDANRIATSAAATGTRTTQTTSTRRDRTSRRDSDRSGSNNSTVDQRATTRGATGIQLRSRPQTNTTPASGTSNRQTVVRANQQRRTTAPTNTARPAPRLRPTTQRQRPTTNASRPKPEARQRVSRTPTVNRPSNSAQRNTPAVRSTPPASNRSTARKEAPSRSSRRERKNNR